MVRPTASWLSGPEPAEPGQDSGYPGQRLGLPETGPRSMARFGRRIGALFIDWLIAYGLAAMCMSFGLIGAGALSTAVLVIWFVLGVIAVRRFGFTPGQLVFGLLVTRVDGVAHVGLGRAVARGLLIALVIPPLFTDSDLRGLQDRFTGTAVVRR